MKTAKYRSDYATRTGQNTRSASIMAGCFTTLEREYTEDSQGRKVRVFTRDNQCQTADIRELCLNVRVVTEEDALAIIGKNMLRYYVKNGGFVKANGSDFYWITDTMAARYNLPKVMGCKFPRNPK